MELYFARDSRPRTHEPRHEDACRRASRRRSDRTRPASATCSGTRSRARRIRSASSARCRTGSSAISSMPCRASRRSPRSAAMSSSTRSTSIRTGSATYNLPLSAVVSAVRASNLNVGGNVLESNGAWLIVRGVGLIASVDDVKRIVVGGVERRPDLRRAGGERPDRRRVPRRVAREGHAGSGRRRRRRAHRRQHEGRHRRGEGAHRADRAGPAAGRHDRAVLRPVGR